MKLGERIGPFAYSVLHAHNMLLEIVLLPGELQIAREDLAELEARLPFLRGYARAAAGVQSGLRAAYDDYAATVSPASIISFPLATFLGVLCQSCRPEHILDLGSGFSSYVFGSYARGSDPNAHVRSVDLSARWLGRTQHFLDAHAVAGVELCDLDAFRAAPGPVGDLVLLDIGELADRLQLLDLTLQSCKPGGLIVIDDMHVPYYRQAMRQQLQARGLAHFSLRAWTRRRLCYAFVVMR